MGSAAPSPKALSPPLGSMQKPPDACGKNGALAPSAIFPPPPAHAAGLAAGGGGGGAPCLGSSLLRHEEARRASAANAADESVARGIGGGASLAPFFIAPQSLEGPVPLPVPVPRQRPPAGPWQAPRRKA